MTVPSFDYAQRLLVSWGAVTKTADTPCMTPCLAGTPATFRQAVTNLSVAVYLSHGRFKLAISSAIDRV
jgi:hypothetical protein